MTRIASGRLLLLAYLLMGVPRAARSEFQCIEAPDLRLIYPAPTLSYLAPYTARCFENAMKFHRRLFGYTPSEPVNVILDDAGDYGNAGVWVSPRNSMSVHVAPSNFVYETGPSNERINFTMNHEVVHVVALDQTCGFDSLLRRLLHGKVRETPEHPETMVYSFLTMPRRAAPRWYHEGAAVFFETWMAGGLGRAQGPYDEMVFRSMVRDGSRIYDPLGLESEGTKVDFQVGVNSYLYGTRFLSYMAYRYTPERLIEWVAHRPGSKGYFASQFHHVYGLPLNEAWRQWTEWERGYQQANLDSIRKYPTTSYRDLSPRALGSVSRACLDPERRVLYAAVQYPGAVAHIAAIPLDGGPVRAIHEVKGPALYFVASLARDPRSGTLFYTSDNNEWRDLCSLDPKTGKSRVLIRDARIGDLAWNAADSSLWAVRHFNGISTLLRLTSPYRDWARIVSLPYGQDMFDLDISPDGTRLSASFAEISGRQTLRLMKTRALQDRDTTTATLYDFGSAIPTGFVFSPDGRYLFGSSYYTGVSNIWRYDLTTDSMTVVSNCETGFFRPVPVAADSLVVFRYSGQGFLPAAIEAKPLQDVSAITFLGQQLVEKYPVLRDWRIAPPSTVNIDSMTTYSGPYRAVSQIAVTSVYPIVEGYKEYTAVGVQANLSDPLMLHTVGLSATYTPASGLAADERWHLSLGYRRFHWNAGFRWNAASFYDLAGPTRSSRKGYGVTFGYDRALISDSPRELTFSAGLSGYSGLERLPDFQNVATSPGFDKLVMGNAQLDYRNLRASIGASDHEKGVHWRAAAVQNMVRQGYAGQASWRGFPLSHGTFDAGTPLPIRNSSLWLRTAAGISPGDRNEPFANFFFGGFGNNWVDRGEVKRYRDYDAFPGRALNEIGGRNFTKALLDWNLPALRFRRVGKAAFYATWTRLSLFTGGLVTNLDHEPSRRRVADAGAQADVRFQLFTQQPLTFSVGYARAFEHHRLPTREWMVSLKIL